MRTSWMVSSRLSPVNPGAMAAISSGVASTPTSTRTADHEREQRADGAGHTIGGLPLAARDERGVHRDEGRRERALAEQVLQEVRDAERGVERVRRVRLEAEVMREDLQPDEAGEAAEKNARRDEHRTPSGFAGSPVRGFAGSVRGFAGSAVRRFADSPVRASGGSLVRWFRGSERSVGRARAWSARVAAMAARAGRAHLARAAAGVRREDRQPALERRPPARGALRRFSAADEKLELMRAALALIFVEGHWSIIAGGAYCVARGASYPSFSIPDFMPLTVPCVSHSSDARNSNR